MTRAIKYSLKLCEISKIVNLEIFKVKKFSKISIGNFQPQIHILHITFRNFALKPRADV